MYKLKLFTLYKIIHLSVSFVGLTKGTQVTPRSWEMSDFPDEFKVTRRDSSNICIPANLVKFNCHTPTDLLSMRIILQTIVKALKNCSILLKEDKPS